jgi:hypothetical protein
LDLRLSFATSNQTVLQYCLTMYKYF